MEIEYYEMSENGKIFLKEMQKDRTSMEASVIRALRQYENKYNREFFKFKQEEMEDCLKKIYSKTSEETIRIYSDTHIRYLKWLEKKYNYKMSFSYKKLIDSIAEEIKENIEVKFLDRNDFFNSLKEYKDTRGSLILGLLFEGVGVDTYNTETMNLKIYDIKDNKLSLVGGRHVIVPNDIIEIIDKSLFMKEKRFKENDYLIQGQKNLNRDKSQILRDYIRKFQKYNNDYTPRNIKQTGKCFYLNLLEKKNGELKTEDYFRIIYKYDSGESNRSIYKLKDLYKRYKNDITINKDYNIKDFKKVLEDIDSININQESIGNISSNKSKSDGSESYDKYLLEEISTIIEEGEKIQSPKYRNEYIKGRVGQGKFREKLIFKHGYKCAICSINNKQLLIASHIKEFCECKNNEHIDEYNGLLLCANHDKLFDKHFISFDEQGKILVSKDICLEDYSKLNIDENIIIDKKNFKEEYMMIHRNKLR